MWPDLLNAMNAKGLENIQLNKNRPIEDLGMTSLIERFPDTPLAKLASRVGKEQLTWLGQDGATPDQIRAAERRLGVTFPKSYRDFLLHSNGFLIPGSYCCILLPVDLVRRFGDDNPEIVALWEDNLRKDPVLRDDNDFTSRIGNTIQVSMEPQDYDLFALIDTECEGPEGEPWTIMYDRQGSNEYPTFAKLVDNIGSG